MDKGTTKLVALMAIKEIFVSRMIDGTKRVEFRRTVFRETISHVVVYESRGRGKIVGYFEVEEVTSAKPSRLWRIFSDVAGVSKSEFLDYFDGTDEGMGISIGKFYEFRIPMDISKLNPRYRPPQSFFYLRGHEFKRIRRRSATRKAA